MQVHTLDFENHNNFGEVQVMEHLLGETNDSTDRRRHCVSSIL